MIKCKKHYRKRCRRALRRDCWGWKEVRIQQKGSACILWNILNLSL